MQKAVQWIGWPEGRQKAPSGSIVFRKELVLENGLEKATVTFCGLGICCLYVNGHPAGSHVLAPLETRYDRRVLFEHMDISAYLHPGKNILCAEVGNGRYATGGRYCNWRARHYGPPILALQLETTSISGARHVFTADETWKCGTGAAIHNCFYDGEECDGRISAQGYISVDYDDTSWPFAHFVPGPTGKTAENRFFHLAVLQELSPVAVHTPLEGTWIFDFGQNVSGWARVQVKGRKGARIQLRYAERFIGAVPDFTSNRFALNTDTYILSGQGEETFAPRFTLHGFSAVEIVCLGCDAQVLDAAACVVGADIPRIGSFSCDLAELNRLHDCVMRSQQAALMSFPLDCPQRDERLGWLGDAYATDLVCLYNYDMRQYYAKWFADIRDTCDEETGSVPIIAPWHCFGHSMEWSGTFPLMVWDAYRFTGDLALLQDNYSTLCRYADYLIRTPQARNETRYGDWQSAIPGWKRGDPACCGSVFYFAALATMAKIARVLAQHADEERFAASAREAREALLAAFGRDDGGFDDNSQFSLAAALWWDIIPKERQPQAFEQLLESISAGGNHVLAGIYGAKYLLMALCRFGRQDVALSLMLQKTAPGWLDMLSGSTTLREKWDGSDSQNHCMFGSVDAALYAMLAGITVENGIRIQPYYAPAVSHVQAHTFLQQTAISVSWAREGALIHTCVEIQGNASVHYWQNGAWIKLGCGKHEFDTSNEPKGGAYA